jgi:hypothetical protein
MSKDSDNRREYASSLLSLHQKKDHKVPLLHNNGRQKTFVVSIFLIGYIRAALLATAPAFLAGLTFRIRFALSISVRRIIT